MRYAWQSDSDAHLAHACEISQYQILAGTMRPSNRGICQVALGSNPLPSGLGFDQPSTEKAAGKPRCGVCQEILKEKHGSTATEG